MLIITRKRLQRAVAVTVLVVAISVAGWAEWLGWVSQQRIAEATQTLQRLALARHNTLRERADHLRRHLNRPGSRAWSAALTTLAKNDPPKLRAWREGGTWKLELETTSLESARRFAAAFGGQRSLVPERVNDGFGWRVIAEVTEEAWIGWPS